MDGRAAPGKAVCQVDRDDLARLQAALEPDRHAFDQRAFGQAAPAMLAKHAEMQQDVAVELVADDEAEAARGVEPFHPAA